MLVKKRAGRNNPGGKEDALAGSNRQCAHDLLLNVVQWHVHKALLNNVRPADGLAKTNDQDKPNAGMEEDCER